REQISVPFVDIEFDAVMKFPKIDRTQMQWPSITLIQVIGTIHQTIKENAVLNSEHMTCLMRQDFTTPAEYDSGAIEGPDSVKSGIVSSKAKYADTFNKRCFPKNKVP